MINSGRAKYDLYRRGVLLFLFSILIILIIVSLGTGAVTIEPMQVIAIVIHRLGITSYIEATSLFSTSQEAVLSSIRAPRVAMCVVVGSGLSVAGATMQGMFRNPLADPGLIGVSGGAALTAVAVIVLGATTLNGLETILGSSTLPVADFLGGMTTTLIVFRLGTRNGYTDASTVLLAGIAINAIVGAGIGLLMFLADDQQLRTLTFWTLGSLGGTTWSSFWSAAPWVLAATLLIPLHARALNALLLGEAEASHLGYSLESLKKRFIFLVAMAVGASVAIAGVIGFVGLVVPHLLRLAIGPDYRHLLPCCALLGASLLLLADLLARTIVTPAEMPIGIITALVGGPFFIWLLVRRTKGEYI